MLKSMNGFNHAFYLKHNALLIAFNFRANSSTILNFECGERNFLSSKLVNNFFVDPQEDDLKSLSYRR